nr:hypothetical protein [uncultured Oscillibacter sp.]
MEKYHSLGENFLPHSGGKGWADQKLHRYKQRGQQTFFRQFLMVYNRFRSVPFAFWHSLKAVFPCAPRLSVAVYVVRNHCGTLNFRSG